MLYIKELGHRAVSLVSYSKSVVELRGRCGTGDIQFFTNHYNKVVGFLWDS